MKRNFIPPQEGENGGDGGGGGGGDGGAPVSFHTMVKNPELQTWAQQRGWKDPDAVVESFRNAEKLLGAPKDRVMVLPEAADAPEWDAIYARLGRPESADKYNIELKGAYDEGFLGWFKGVAHKGKLSNDAAALIATEWEGYVDNMVAEQQRESEAATEAEVQKLRAEWGSGFEANTNAAKDAAKRVGLNDEQFAAVEAAIGPVAARKAFGLVASRVLEGGPPLGDGGGTGFGGTPEAAQMQLTALEGDSAFMAKYLGGDKAALKKMSDLRAAAYPGAA